MPYVFSYKSQPSMSDDSLMQYPYRDHNNEINVLLLNKNDFNINNRNKAKIQRQALSTDYHRQPKLQWDRLRDIDCLLNSKMYKAALLLALTIPDICSKVEYGMNENLDERYPKWINEHVYKYDIGEHGHNSCNFDCVNGYFCYRLRCNLVHGEQIDIEEIVNKPESSFKSVKQYEKIFFKLTNKDYSELFVIENDNNQQYAIVLHSIIQLIKTIICAADVLYEETNDKSLFGDGCFIQTYPQYKAYKLDNDGRLCNAENC